MSLDLYRGNGVFTNVAPCNSHLSNMSVDARLREREKPISAKEFRGFMALTCERFGRTPSEEYLKHVYRTLNEHMGDSEFRAAAKDAVTKQFNYQDLVPVLVEHVKTQRDEGPDLMALEYGDFE